MKASIKNNLLDLLDILIHHIISMLMFSCRAVRAWGSVSLVAVTIPTSRMTPASSSPRSFLAGPPQLTAGSGKP